MKSRPILMSAPMVRAILDGRKTQTRRVMKPQPEHAQCYVYKGETLYDAEHRMWWWKRHCFENLINFDDGRRELAKFCPYGAPGAQLWVRETHAQFSVGEGLDTPVPTCVAYRATHDGGFDYIGTRGQVTSLKVTKWTPAIHMPRWASRITLEVTSVRVERVQEISEEDALAEGVKRAFSYRTAFELLWKEINGAQSWLANPFVWVVSFRRVEAQGKEAA